MLLKWLPLCSKFAFVFLFFSLLFCVDIALGSLLDVHVYYEGKPADNASVYIDGDILLGQTDSKGILNDVNISPGTHTVVAKWWDRAGNEQSGRVSFAARSDTLTMKRIDLQQKTPKNLGWIWQFVKDING